MRVLICRRILVEGGIPIREPSELSPCTTYTQFKARQCYIYDMIAEGGVGGGGGGDWGGDGGDWGDWGTRGGVGDITS